MERYFSYICYAPLVAFYDTLGIRRTYSRLKPRRPHGGSPFGTPYSELPHRKSSPFGTPIRNSRIGSHHHLEPPIRNSRTGSHHHSEPRTGSLWAPPLLNLKFMGAVITKPEVITIRNPSEVNPPGPTSIRNSFTPPPTLNGLLFIIYVKLK